MSDLGEIAEVLGRFVLAFILAGLLGLERERRGRAAGLRTHILVCLGSTMLMLVADFIARKTASAGFVDQSRMAAGIVTGIGFLGAGTIMTANGTHRGLTTAAMIWFVAALGVAIGAGLYLLAVSATGVALLTVLGLQRVSDTLPYHERFVLSIRIPGGADMIPTIEAVVRRKGFHVSASRLQTAGKDRVDMTFEIAAPASANAEELIRELQTQIDRAEQITLER